MSLTTIPYKFQYDYCNKFFNFARATNTERAMVEHDFIQNLSTLLKKLHNPSALTIAETLFARMSDPKLFYHTPIHILAILQFASVHNIRLAWWEELAVWFHDSVYVPNAKSGVNEWASSKFMEAMLGPFIANQRLTWIAMAIGYTSCHLSAGLPSQFDIILDLDLCSFLFEYPGRDLASNCVLLEFDSFPPNRIAVLKGRLEFMTKLVQRGCPLYRSRAFSPFLQEGTEFVLREIGRTRDDLNSLERDDRFEERERFE